MLLVYKHWGDNMTQNEQLIYDYIKTTDATEVSAQFLSNELKLQRSNVSSILNRLVKKGYLEKKDGRPVLFFLAPDKSELGTNLGFRSLVGNEGTNKNAVQLAKAAILYPNGSLNSIIIGQRGTGITHFVSLMYWYAIEQGAISADAEFVKFNCKHYADDPESMVHELFGARTSDFENMLERTKEGFLFIDHVEFLPASARDKLLMVLEKQSYVPLKSTTPVATKVTLILSCDESINNAVLESFVQKIPVRIELPSLTSYNLAERFYLINHFFALESLRINRKLTINSELLVCLLLYDCPGNIKQLRYDIQLGCANAYVRDIHTEGKPLPVFISDFNHYVRKGFLYYKNNREKLLELIPDDYNYTYDGHAVEQTIVVEYELKKRTIYDDINDKVTDLKKRAIEQNDINMIISAELETIVARYKNVINTQVDDARQLSKLVNPKLIRLVSEFLSGYKVKFDRELSVAVFNGLCLHIHETLSRVDRAQMLSNEQIMAEFEHHREEYLYSLEFVSKLELAWNVKLPIDEVVFITMFITQKNQEIAESKQPVLLIAMHGEGVATAISSVVKSLTKSQKVYAFDLSLEQSAEEAYIMMKQQIEKINENRGVLVVYDMGSIQTMCEMVQEETNILVRTVNIPITLVAIDIARKIMMEQNIDAIHQDSVQSLHNYYQANFDSNQLSQKQLKQEAIITVCTTGEGGALQLKKYLEKYLGNEYEIINLSLLNRNSLYRKLDEIAKQYKIKAIVGAIDLQYNDVPFIPLNKIFEIDGVYIKDIIEGNLKGENLYSDLDEIYNYLDEQLVHVNVDKLRSLLPNVMTQLNQAVDNELSIEQKLGLFIHIACGINRILAKEECPINLHKEYIITKHKNLFNTVIKCLKPLERSFRVVFTDDEVANIVTIMKKL